MSSSDNFSDSDLSDIDPLDETFSEAAEHLQKIHDKLLTTDLLEIYALYKQATCGRCTTPKPSVFNMQSRSKWCAWNDLGEMPTNEAKRLYIEKVKAFDSDWKPRQKSYPAISGVKRTRAASGATGWVVHSTPQSLEVDADPKRSDHEKTIFDYVKEGDLVKLRKALTPECLELLDEENGMGLIHWATDRNAVDILKYLIECGVDINFRDAEQQTALHYAASCGHMECLRILLAAKADVSIRDAEGQSCVDVAESADICELLKV